MNPIASGASPEGRPGEGPGLAKTTRVKLFQSRTFRLVASSDARWGELFDAADVMSEGAHRGEGSERSYFGSSNIILLIAPEDPSQTVQSLAGAVARDPHVRLRAMRVARREAAQRANAPLDCVRAEITVSPCTTGVAVHVEVEASVLPDRRTKPRDAKTNVPVLPAMTHSGAALALPVDPLPVESPTLARPAVPPPNGAPL
jgi:hypothetical protein